MDQSFPTPKHQDLNNTASTILPSCSLQDEKYRQIYMTMGYLPSDFAEVNIRTLARQAAEFIKDLEPQDKQFYLQKKYEAMVARRNKIIADVNEEYEYRTRRLLDLIPKTSIATADGRRNTTANVSFYTERAPKMSETELSSPSPSHPVIDELKQKQKHFYNKQTKYYEKVRLMREKKALEYFQVQDAGYFNSQHFKLMSERHRSLSLSQRSQTSTSLRRERQNTSTSESRRRKVMQEHIRLNEQEMSVKQAKLHEKLQSSQQKIQRVYHNLRLISLNRKQKSEIEKQNISKNKHQIRLQILSDIKKKDERTKSQIAQFETNRTRELKKVEQKLESQKSLYVKREDDVKKFQREVVMRRRDEHVKELEQQMQLVAENKRKLQHQRRLEIAEISKIRKEKEQEANRTKQYLQLNKEKRNEQLYHVYKNNLRQAVVTKTQKIKQVKTKLLEEKVKEEMAKLSLQVLSRQEAFRKSQLTSRRELKKATMDLIIKSKEKVVQERRRFLGRTLRKLDKEDFNNRTICFSVRRQPSAEAREYRSTALSNMRILAEGAGEV